MTIDDLLFALWIAGVLYLLYLTGSKLYKKFTSRNGEITSPAARRPTAAASEEADPKKRKG